MVYRLTTLADAVTSINPSTWHYVGRMVWAMPVLVPYCFLALGITLVVKRLGDEAYVVARVGHEPTKVARALALVHRHLHLEPMPEHEHPVEVLDDGAHLRLWLVRHH